MLLPVAAGAKAVSLARAPFDPVYPSLDSAPTTISVSRHIDLPFSTQLVKIADDGTVTAFSRPAPQRAATCAPTTACAPSQAASPFTLCTAFPMEPTRGQSPSFTYCLNRADRNTAWLATSPDGSTSARLPTAHMFSLAYPSISDKGEIFFPTPDGGFDRADRAGVHHAAASAGRVLAVARLGQTGRIVVVTEAPTEPHTVLRMIEGGDIAQLALPARLGPYDDWLAASPDGAWCVLNTGMRKLALYRMADRAILPAGSIDPHFYVKPFAFSPSGRFLVVVGTGLHDPQPARTAQRATVFQLTASTAKD